MLHVKSTKTKNQFVVNCLNNNLCVYVLFAVEITEGSNQLRLCTYLSVSLVFDV